MAVVQVAVHVLVSFHCQRLVEEGLVDHLCGGVQLPIAHSPVDQGRLVTTEIDAAVQRDVLPEVHVFVLVETIRGVCNRKEMLN